MLLLVSQGFDWIEGSRLARRVKAKENSNRAAEQERNRD
jgi:hypothetical protein